LIETTSGAANEKILVVRLSAMGDVIHTLPAVQALRNAFPHAVIGWLVEERWSELLCSPGMCNRGLRSPQRPLVDWVHTVKLVGWRKSLFELSTAEQIARVWNDVRSMQYRVAVDLQGAIRSAVLARCSGAPIIYGSAQTRESPASMWYTRPVIPHGRHIIEQNLSVIEAFVGGQRDVPEIPFPHDAKAEARIAGQISDHDFAILNPGAGWGAKRWPAERYGKVAGVLAKFGVRSVVNYGPGEEDLARAAETASGGAAQAIRCSISELIALTRRTKLFIGGDTGPLHLAAALHVPVVAIFGPTDPARNGPYGTRSVVLRNSSSETSHARRVQPDEGMLEITVDAVADAVRGLLDRKPSEAAHG
jgi:lipopolysaccharide heptosyltransferase I